MKRVENMERLRKILGEPHALTQKKIYDHLFDDAQAFIRQAPLLFMATADAQGRVTVSPKGDAAGFVRIENEHQLLIPERPGNKLLHGFGNLFERDGVGLIFLVPGTGETLRVNGSAALFEDEDICSEMAANGKNALLLIRITVRECFFHCAKAFKRSGAWEPDSWPESRKISFGKQIARQAAKGKIAETAVSMAVDQAVKSNYKKDL